MSNATLRSQWPRTLIGFTAVTALIGVITYWWADSIGSSFAHWFWIAGIPISVAMLTYREMEARVIGSVALFVWTLALVSLMSIVMFDVGI